MQITLISLAVILCIVAIGVLPVRAGDRQERRIEQLEMENARLRGQLKKLQYQQQNRRLPEWGNYQYGRSPMNDAARQMNEANGMKRSWEQLTR